MIFIKTLNEFLDTDIKFNLNSVGREDWDLHLTNNTTKQFIVYLSPDEFLNRVKYDSFSIESNKIQKYSDSIKNSNSETPVPCMWFTNQYQYENGYRPEFHDGQHRVLALKQLGIKSIPIKIIIDIE